MSYEKCVVNLYRHKHTQVLLGNVKLYLKEHFDGLLMFVCKRQERDIILLFWLSNFEKSNKNG